MENEYAEYDEEKVEEEIEGAESTEVPDAAFSPSALMTEPDSIFIAIPRKWRHEVKILRMDLQVLTDHKFLPALIPRAVALDLVVCDTLDGRRITVHKQNLDTSKWGNEKQKKKTVQLGKPKRTRPKRVPKSLQYLLGSGTIDEVKQKLGLL